jgi:hypothetical protein
MRGGAVSEFIEESVTELTIETFVNRMKGIHHGLDRQEFHEAIVGCVQEAVIAAGLCSRAPRYARQLCRGSQKNAGSIRRKKASHVRIKEDSGV